CGLAFWAFIKLRKQTRPKPYQNRRFCALTTENFPFVHQRLGSGVNLFYPLPDHAKALCLRFEPGKNPGFFIDYFFVLPLAYA
ncbi:hypothetical protein, partial [Eubacterium barkeri]|uniref:hypothetical protein n=1 Tax=Eubacterium barkeri TaxID=1528 RepID=UPI001A9A3B6A